MTNQTFSRVILRVLSPPNSDLAIDSECLVWKLKRSGWTKLNYQIDAESDWAKGAAHEIEIEV